MRHTVHKQNNKKILTIGEYFFIQRLLISRGCADNQDRNPVQVLHNMQTIVSELLLVTDLKILLFLE